MLVVNVLSDSDDIASYAVAPLIFNKKKLLSLGYDVRIKTKLSNSLFECNTLCLVSKPTIRLLKESSRIFNSEGPVIQFLNKSRNKVDNIIWMDDSDSTSVTHFEILPYVDKYLKKQLFRDKSLYRKEFYGGRIFSDYYHEKFNVVDDILFQQDYPLDKKYESKLGLSWNIGLGNIHDSFTWKSVIKKFIPVLFRKPDYKQGFVDPKKEKIIDFFIRTSANLSRPSVAFHRLELLRKLIAYQEESNLNSMVGSNVVHNSPELNSLFSSSKRRIPTKKIRKIMSLTKIMPSPFGWGEIGVRDYEAFKYGALLLKPDMSHMETWPDLFIPNETYVPFKWDFSDLAEKIDNFIQDDITRIKVSTAGQIAYAKSISEEGMDDFCKWFIKQIEMPANEN